MSFSLAGTGVETAGQVPVAGIATDSAVESPNLRVSGSIPPAALNQPRCAAVSESASSAAPSSALDPILPRPSTQESTSSLGMLAGAAGVMEDNQSSGQIDSGLSSLEPITPSRRSEELEEEGTGAAGMTSGSDHALSPPQAMLPDVGNELTTPLPPDTSPDATAAAASPSSRALSSDSVPGVNFRDTALRTQPTATASHAATPGADESDLFALLNATRRVPSVSQKRKASDQLAQPRTKALRTPNVVSNVRKGPLAKRPVAGSTSRNKAIIRSCKYRMSQSCGGSRLIAFLQRFLPLVPPQSRSQSGLLGTLICFAHLQMPKRGATC